MKINFHIYILFFLIKFIKSSSDRQKHLGKCVFFISETGSEIINFHKYKNKDYINKNENFSINICNDTKYDISGNNTQHRVDSQIVYYQNNNKCNPIRLSGPYYVLKNENDKDKVLILNKENDDRYITTLQSGDFCDSYKNISYSTSFIFEHKDSVDDNLEIDKYPEDLNNCELNLTLYYNKEYATDYLLIQQVLNNWFIATGIIFIILGIPLCFLVLKFPSVIKILICLVFGQLVFFNIYIIFIGNNTSMKNNLAILIIILGIVISLPFMYFTRTHDRLYSIILSLSSGYICGIFIYEIFFYNTNSAITESILIDVILIFTSSFVGLNIIIPRNYIYYPPFIGSYLLIRGISLFIYNATDKGGFGDLNLLIYLIKLQEADLVEELFDNDYKYFYIYLIFIGLILIVSEVLIFLKNKNERELSFDLEDDETSESNSIRMNKISE